MAARRGQKLKLLYIVKILTQLTDEEHPMSATEICERLAECGVTAERKSIYNDIECLVSFGYDIIFTRTPKNGYFLASREFELPEIFLLCDAVRTAKFISEKKTRELTAKLDGLISKYQSKRNIHGIYIDSSNKTHNEELFYNIDSINTAITEGKKIKFTYSKRVLQEGKNIITESKTRIVSPYAMTWQFDYYYLIGNYEKYDNLMNLRIDRIHSVEILDEPIRHFSEVSDYSDTFDVADYTKKLFGMFGGNTQEIKLRCSNKLLEQVTDRFGENIFITNVNEKTFDFTAKAAVSEGLVTWIMNYGDNIKVIKPDDLKQKIIDRADKILKIYN
ncbi:MAG: WYL domain-containing transcriptional regulator [Acutalibacteraceae bacterium]|nr:WYL domain-containing transcriptional regulator [Acutalibacteraceae bacterium]